MFDHLKDFFMKNKWYLLSFIIGIVSTLLFIFGFKWFPKNSMIDLPTLLIAIGIILGLYGVIWSTNKQIKNQNTESHRPYLQMYSLSTANPTLDINYMVYAYPTPSEASDCNFDPYDSNSFITLSLSVRNIGYGIAYGVELFSFGDNLIYPSPQKPNSTQPIHCKHIGLNNGNDIYINVICHKTESNTYKDIDLLLAYSDLSGNIYKNIISFALDHSIHNSSPLLKSYLFYYQNSFGFWNKLRDMGISNDRCDHEYFFRINHFYS